MWPNARISVMGGAQAASVLAQINPDSEKVCLPVVTVGVVVLFELWVGSWLRHMATAVLFIIVLDMVTVGDPMRVRDQP